MRGNTSSSLTKKVSDYRLRLHFDIGVKVKHDESILNNQTTCGKSRQRSDSAHGTICRAIKDDLLHPALIIGMPIGFSHAPAAKRLLMRSGIPFITIVSSLGGGLLAATSLNTLAQSLIDKPDCHCYLLGWQN